MACACLTFGGVPSVVQATRYTGWSIKRFVRTTRRYRTVQIRAGQQTLTADAPPSRPTATALAHQLTSSCALT